MLCLTQQQRKKWNPPTSLVWVRKASRVWSGMAAPPPCRRAGNSSSLPGILQSGVQEVLAAVRPIIVPQSAVSAVRFYAATGAGLVLTPRLARDVPKDTVKSIICNTTVIICFSSLAYVFVGLGVEGFLSSVELFFSANKSRSAVQKQWLA